MGSMVNGRVTQLLQGRMSATDLIETSHEQFDVRFGVEVAGTVLILLGVCVLLASRQRLVLADLEARVHAPRRAHGRSQDCADGESGRVAIVEVDRVDVRGVGEEVRTVEVRGLVGDLVEVLLQLPLGGAPGEVGVALLEADLAKGSHHLGTGEGLGQEDDLGMTTMHLLHEPGPEVDRLGVRVVDAEDRHPVRDPQLEQPQALVVDSLRGVVEVDRVDVLVLLRWVLRVGDGAVDAGGEPLRVLLHPRVVRGCLQGEVQGYLHTQVMGVGDEAVEVREGAKIWVDGVMAASRGTNGPWRTGIVGPGGQGVVPALAESSSDGVDRWQVDDVESHRSSGVQSLPGGVEGAGDPVAVLVDVSSLGAREEFVPGAVEGAAPLDPQRGRGGGRGQWARSVDAHRLGEGDGVDDLAQ